MDWNFTTLALPNERCLHLEKTGLAASIYIKRLDLNHPEVQGNKAYKLKYNLLKARQHPSNTLLTFGGAYSNHIYSTAAAAHALDLRCIGIIRGEKPATLSPTLRFAESKGMQLAYVSRAEYREKDEAFFKAWLRYKYGSFYLVPEGGSNYLGTQGCSEILDSEDKSFDVICCSVGTGATFAGLMLSARDKQQVIGFAALKGHDYLCGEIIHHLTYALGSAEAAQELFEQHLLLSDYHFGGFAKTQPEQKAFHLDFEKETGIAIDRIYMSKMLLGIQTELAKGRWEGKRLLIIHSGGLQGGWNGFES